MLTQLETGLWNLWSRNTWVARTSLLLGDAWHGGALDNERMVIAGVTYVYRLLSHAPTSCTVL